jgi:hypothetical protein
VHSRIFQISESPVKKEDFLDESDFTEHWFTNEIADYVSDEVDRLEDISLLRNRLNDIVTFDADTFSLLPNGKKKYFSAAYQTFTEARDKTLGLDLSEFASGKILSELIRKMMDSYCEQFSFYVSLEDEIITLDEFIRGAENGQTYHIGTTLDYHF